MSKVSVEGGNSSDEARAIEWRPGGMEPRDLVLPIACLLACSALFLWMLDRGFDFRDEAYYLLWANAANAYNVSTSEFAYVWHPLYLAVGGDIALYRLTGAIVLGLCGLSFGLAICSFSATRGASSLVRATILIATTTAIFWQFLSWEPTPNYNELNLCASLLFFSGLLFASRHEPSGSSNNPIMATIASSALAGASVAIMVLAKPTSAVVAIVLGLGWLVLVRPSRPILCVAVAALSSAAILAAVVLAIDGGFDVFMHRKLTGLEFSIERSAEHDIHGILGSVVGPFLAERRWKILPALSFGFVIFCICSASFSLELLPNRVRRSWRILLQLFLAVLLGFVVALWRAIDVGSLVLVPAYHAWRFAPLLILLALVAVAFATGSIDLRVVRTRRWFAAVVLLALAPLPYSFGTDNAIVNHMTMASVLWVGSGLLFAMLLPDASAPGALRIVGTKSGAATLGLMIGIVFAPGIIRHPMWQEVVPVKLAGQVAVLKVDAPTATYIGAMQRAALANGFAPGTPIIDLSGAGPGLIFALNGKASVVPWLANSSADNGVFATAVLRLVSRAELKRSWVMTAPSQDLHVLAGRLARIGLAFPRDYVLVGQVRRTDLGWSQALWKPRLAPVNTP